MDSTEKFMPEFGVRVFLVEDNPEHSFIAVTVIRQLLGEASEVIVAENAEEAVGLIAQFTENDRPDLMLVDLRLPDNGGFSVLTAARSIRISRRAMSSVLQPSCASRCRVQACVRS
jgi:CheY-like chemotaxis protein